MKRDSRIFKQCKANSVLQVKTHKNKQLHIKYNSSHMNLVKGLAHCASVSCSVDRAPAQCLGGYGARIRLETQSFSLNMLNHAHDIVNIASISFFVSLPSLKEYRLSLFITIRKNYDIREIKHDVYFSRERQNSTFAVCCLAFVRGNE